MKAPQDVRDFAARLARTAFTTGVRVAALPQAERERVSTTMQQTAVDMLEGFLEAEVERRLAEARG